MYVPQQADAGFGAQQIQPRQPKKENPFNKFEEDKDDSMQIMEKPLAEKLFAERPMDGFHNNMSQGSGLGAQIQADNMDAFLSDHEKKRAATIYQ